MVRWLGALLACAPGALGPTDGGPSSETDDSGATSSLPDPEPFPLCLNEVMPTNLESLADESGAHPDWIEIHNPGQADVSLAGWTLTDDREDPGRHALGDRVVPAGGFLVLFADGAPALGDDHLGFSLAEEGEEVGLYAPDGRGTVVVYGPIAADLSLARVPDCCAGDGCWQYPFGGSPGESNQVAATRSLKAAGSSWKYWDRGFLPALDWVGEAYDDADWTAGQAPFGYGEGSETGIGWGNNPSARFETTWFRTTVQVSAPEALGVVRLRVLRDDGVAVYVNGIPVFRNNLPGASGEDVLAVHAIEGVEEKVWLESEVSPDRFVEGENTLAVEVHQASLDSDDLAFDLELLVAR